MRRHSLVTSVLAVVLSVSLSVAALAKSSATPSDSPNKHSLESLARLALEANAGSANAIEELRSMGPEGLLAFLETNRLEIEAAIKPTNASKGVEGKVGVVADPAR